MDKIKLRIKIDKAIDEGNIQKIQELLDELPTVGEKDIKLENPIEFANRIRIIKNKEEKTMKKKFSKITLIAASLAVIGAVSVSGAMFYNYSFQKGDTFYTVTSDKELNKDEVENMAENIEKAKKETQPNESNTAKYIDFDSIEEAEKQLNMDIILPEKMPDLELEEIKASQMYVSENSGRTSVWLTYGDVNSKLFGITIIKDDIADEDVTIISGAEVDEGSMGSYTSKKGYKFTTLKESDEEGKRTADIATIKKGNYEYSLVFFGFEKDEMESIIDSLSL